MFKNFSSASTTLLCSTAFAALLSPAALHAQEAPAEASTASTDDRIIVTARKREEDQQDVPLAITAFTAEQIQRQQINSLTDVAARTPGFSFESYASGALETPVIRGQAQAFLTNPVQNVATFVDGIYLQRGYMIDGGLIDMERIEILKGPQSALYGQNAFSGAISYVTKKASNEFELRATGTVGTDERLDLTGAIGVPIIPDMLSVRVGGGINKFDGTWENSHPLADENVPGPSTEGNVGGYDNWAVNAGVVFTPTDWITVEGSYYRTEIEEESPAQYMLVGGIALGLLRLSTINDFNCSPTLRSGVMQNNLWCGELPSSPEEVPGAGVNRSGAEPAIDPRSFGQSGVNEIYRASASLDLTDDLNLFYQYGKASSRVFSARTFARDTIAGLPQGAVFGLGSGLVSFDSQPNGKLEADSHEIRLAYDNGGAFNALGGVYFYNSTDFYGSRLWYQPPLALTPLSELPVLSPANLTILDNETFAIYGSVQYQLGAWEFTAEARYNDEKSARFTAPDPLNAGPEFYFDLPDIPANPDLDPASFNFWTPRFTIKYEVSPNSQIYVSAARGAKAGGFNRRTIDPAFETYDPEFNWTYEIGTKNVLLNGALIVNASAFYIDWTNLQISGREPDALVTDAAIITNLGGAKTWGLELATSYQPIDELTLSGTVSYVEPKVDDGVIFLEAVAGNWCSSGVCDPAGDIGGNTLPRTPKTQLTLAADWQAPLNAGMDYFLRADTTYQSRQFASFLNVGWVPERFLVNGSVGLEADRWSLQLWAKNLLDREYVSSSLFGGAFNYAPVFGERRTVGLTATFDY